MICLVRVRYGFWIERKKEKHWGVTKYLQLSYRLKWEPTGFIRNNIHMMSQKRKSFKLLYTCLVAEGTEIGWQTPKAPSILYKLTMKTRTKKNQFQPEMKYYNTWIALSWALSARLTQMYAPNRKVFSIKQYQLLPNNNYHIKAKVYVVSSSLFYFIRALTCRHFIFTLQKLFVLFTGYQL